MASVRQKADAEFILGRHHIVAEPIANPLFETSTLRVAASRVKRNGASAEWSSCLLSSFVRGADPLQS